MHIAPIPPSPLGDAFQKQLAAFTEKILKMKDNAVRDAIANGCPQCKRSISTDRDDLRILDLPAPSLNTPPEKVQVRFLLACKRCLPDEQIPYALDFFS